MLEKNKDYIELKAACCSANYCQGYMTHLDITGYSNSDLATPLPNPGIDYILISKEKFEALQTENEQLKKKLHECEKDYIFERDRAEAFENEIEIYSRTLKEWKEATCYPNPSSAKTAIESGASWCLAYNKVKKKYDQAIEMIGEWQRATGHFLPKVADEELASLKKEVSDYKEQIQSLYKVIERWKDKTKCETPEAAVTWITSYESACERGNKLAKDIEYWQNVTGYSTPEDYLAAVIKNTAKGILSWPEITGFSTPEKCSSYIDTLEKKLEDIKDLIEED